MTFERSVRALVASTMALSLFCDAAGAKTLQEHDAFVLLTEKRLAKIELSHHFKADISGEPTELAFSDLRVVLRVPAIRWGTGAIAFAVKYSLSDFEVSAVADELVDEGAHLLHHAGLAIGLMQVLDERWYLTVGLHPYLSSDFEVLDIDTLFVEGRAEVGWAYSKKLAFRFGVCAHARFGMYLPFPILGLAYKGERWRFDALLPKFLKATLFFGERFSAEVFSELYPQVWDINQAGLGTRAKYMRVKLGAGVEVHLWKGLHLRFAGGVMPFRIITSYELEDASAREYDLRADLAPFFDVGLSWGQARVPRT